jgi:hypothetical protein
MKPTRTYFVRNGMVEVTVTPPPETGFKPSTVKLTPEQFDRLATWLNTGGQIQNVFPDLSADDREILLSGIGPEQWDRAFG